MGAQLFRKIANGALVPDSVIRYQSRPHLNHLDDWVGVSNPWSA